MRQPHHYSPFSIKIQETTKNHRHTAPSSTTGTGTHDRINTDTITRTDSKPQKPYHHNINNPREHPMHTLQTRSANASMCTHARTMHTMQTTVHNAHHAHTVRMASPVHTCEQECTRADNPTGRQHVMIVPRYCCRCHSPW